MAENVFVKYNDEGEVIESIVISPEVLGLGYWGDPSDWTQIQSEEDELDG